MMLSEDIFSLACSCTDCSAEERQTLQRLCAAAEALLREKLRKGVSVEDCYENFVCAAAFLAQKLTPERIRLEPYQAPPTGDERVDELLTQGQEAIRRLRSANDLPLVVVETWLSYARFEGLEQEDFIHNSLYALMEEKYGVRVDRCTRQFEASGVSPDDARLLEMEASRAVCRVHTLAFCKDEPVEYSVARYRGDRNVFTVELFR